MPEFTIEDGAFTEAIGEVLDDNPSLIGERIDHDTLAEAIGESDRFDRIIANAVNYRLEDWEPPTPSFGDWIIEQYHSLPSEVESWCSLGEAVRGIVAAVLTAVFDGSLDGVYPELDQQLTRYRNSDIRIVEPNLNGHGDSWTVVLLDSYGSPYNTVGPFTDYNAAVAYQSTNGNSRIYVTVNPPVAS